MNNFVLVLEEEAGSGSIFETKFIKNREELIVGVIVLPDADLTLPFAHVPQIGVVDCS